MGLNGDYGNRSVLADSSVEEAIKLPAPFFRPKKFCAIKLESPTDFELEHSLIKIDAEIRRRDSRFGLLP